MKSSALLPFAALTLLAGEAVSQTPRIVLRAPAPNSAPTPTNSTFVQGVGFVTKFNSFAINDAGEWLAHVTTDNANVAIADVILRDGFLTLQQGTILGQPQGSTISTFRSVNVDVAGNSMWDLGMMGPQGNSGLFFNTKAIALFGQVMNTPGYSRSAVWQFFNGVVKANDHNQIVVGSSVSDPAIMGGGDDSMVLLTVDNQGNIISSIDIAHEGGQVPMLGHKVPASGLPWNQKAQFALNNLGDVLWQSKLDDPAPDAVLFLNDQVLVKDGDPSPIPGFTWNNTTNARVDLNDHRDWVMMAQLSGPQNQQDLMVVNNQTFLRERSTFPAIAPLLVDNFASKTPIAIGNNREPIYRLSWTGQAATDTGILVGKEIIVRKGVTQMDNLFVDLFIDSEDAIASSPGGRYVMFQVDLEDTSSVVGRIDLGRVTPIMDCAGNTGELKRLSGFPVAGKTITLGMGQGQGIGVTPFLLISDRPIFTYPPCGLTTNFGELIIDFGDNGNPFLLKIGNPYAGSPVAITLPIANNPALIDQHVYAQGIFVNFAGQAPGAATLLLTNALDIEIGAP